MNPYQSPGQPLSPFPLQRPRSVWPKVIGIISIIFGAIGIVSALGSFLGAEALSSLMKKQYTPQMLADMTELSKEQGMLGLPINLLLLVGGILTIYRRKIGVLLLLLFAVASIGWAAYSVKKTSEFNKKVVAEFKAEFPDSKDTEANATLIGLELMSNPAAMIATLLLASAYPLFLLTWLLIPKFRRDWAAWP